MTPEQVQDLHSAAEGVEGFVREYFRERGLVWPASTYEALAFLNTELAEAYEVLLSKGEWVRNHPDAKPSWSPERFSTELGDVIMMAMVAGMNEGQNPLLSLIQKMERKLNRAKGSTECSPSSENSSA